MIGQIDSQRDITIYLTSEEVAQLETQTLEGVLIKRPRPKQQGKVLISVNDQRSTEHGFGIGVVDTGYCWDSVGQFELFMGREAYERLRVHGSVGRRYGTIGHKVEVEDGSKLGASDREYIEFLQDYRDRRDQLPESLG